MTVLSRSVASIPARLATETWLRIVDLIAPTGTAARPELLKVTGIAASLITREVLKNSPVVSTGLGPRVRIYCVYGEDAITGDGLSEQTLPSSPLAVDGWAVSLPCAQDDLPWVQKCLAKLSSKITARDAAESSGAEATDEASLPIATIDREEFMRP